VINSTVPFGDGQPLVEPNLDPKVSMFTAADHWWVQIMVRLRLAKDANRFSFCGKRPVQGAGSQHWRKRLARPD